MRTRGPRTSVSSRDRRRQAAGDKASSLSRLIGGACIAIASSAGAEPWHISASATAQATYTNNVDFAPSGQRESDLVTSLTGTIGIAGGSPRLKLNGSLALTASVDAKGNRNSSIAPVGGLNGTFEAIENFAFVDVAASLAQTYISPFGPQPRDLANDTSNRYTSQTYSVGPYVRGMLPGNLSYTVRDQNTWTVASRVGDTATTLPTAYANTLSANVTRSAAPLGWTVDYNRSYYDSGAPEGTSVVETARGSLPFRVDPQLQLALRAGYERDRFRDRRVQSSIYGVGGEWQPTERTNITGIWEHRFFGAGYSLDITHRLPRAALTASFSRDLSNYPQLALTIPAGANVANFLDAAFTTRIANSAERALAVEQFLARTGLATTLFTPVNFFATTFVLQTSQRASLVLLGVRNSITFTVFHVKSATVVDDPVLSTDIVPAALQFNQNNTQTGAGVNVSHSLSGFTNVNAYANAARVTADSSATENVVNRATNANLGVNLSTQVGHRTTATIGVGYSRFLPEGGTNSSGSSAFNVFAALTHTFR